MRVLGLAQVGDRHLAAAATSPQVAQVGGHLLAVGHLHPGGGADGLPGQVVLGGPDAAGDDDRVGSAHSLGEGGGDPPQVVAHHHLVVVVEARLGQAPADLGGVAVDYLAQEQLGPHGQHLDVHASTSATVSVP